MKLFKKLSQDIDYEWLFIDGTTHDIKVAPELLSRVHLNTTDYVSADKGYDSASFREEIINQGAKAIIPKKRNTLTNNNHMDWHIYKTRHLVENAFARLKYFRDVATRYDKLKQHYENNVALACAYIGLKL